MPFPFVDRAAFERELSYSAHDFPNVESESEWAGLVEDALKTESERVEQYADADASGAWRDADATVPFVVRSAVIRLARQHIAGIKKDGISSEDLVSGAGYDYRPPEALREEVKQALEDAGHRTGDAEFFMIGL